MHALDKFVVYKVPKLLMPLAKCSYIYQNYLKTCSTIESKFNHNYKVSVSVMEVKTLIKIFIKILLEIFILEKVR